MSVVMKEEKLKALVAELAKEVKTEKDFGSLAQQLIKLPVETALSANRNGIIRDCRRNVADHPYYFVQYTGCFSNAHAVC